jgi:hypothetical protein
MDSILYQDPNDRSTFHDPYRVLRKMVLDLLCKFKILLRKLNLAKFLKRSQRSQNSRGTHRPHAQVTKDNSQKGDKEGWPIHMSMVKRHSILKQS